MPRLPSTSWAPRPTRAIRTRDFTGAELREVRAAGTGRRASGRGAPSGAGSQQPGQVAVQTRSRSTWIRPTRSTAVEATGYVYQTDRQCRRRVPESGTELTPARGRRPGWSARRCARRQHSDRDGPAAAYGAEGHRLLE